MSDTAQQLRNALIGIAKSGVTDVSHKMRYCGVMVETCDGPKMASLTLTLTKPPKPLTQ